jgi:hypothetical protein
MAAGVGHQAVGITSSGIVLAGIALAPGRQGRPDRQKAGRQGRKRPLIFHSRRVSRLRRTGCGIGLREAASARART